MLSLLAVCIFGAYVALSLARIQAQLLANEVRFMIGIAEVLSRVSDVSAEFDAYVASQPGTADLQPVADALDTLKAKIVAATPAAS